MTQEYSIPQVGILGCGYVGQAVAQHWGPHYSLTVTTTRSDRLQDLRAIALKVKVLKGNDLPAVQDFLQGLEAVLICPGARYGSYEESYLQTAQTLAQALKTAPTVQHLIYTSSCGVYGDHRGAWVNETGALLATDENARVLAETEQVILSLTQGSRKACVLRLGGIFGPGRELARIYGRSAGGTRKGTGHEAANWVHLDDIVGAVAFAQAQGLEGLYNVVCTYPSTVREIIDRTLAEANLAPVTWDPNQQSDRTSNVRISNQKIRDAGYVFQYPEIFSAS